MVRETLRSLTGLSSPSLGPSVSSEPRTDSRVVLGVHNLKGSDPEGGHQ